jgi:hypothetical protein
MLVLFQATGLAGLAFVRLMQAWHPVVRAVAPAAPWPAALGLEVVVSMFAFGLAWLAAGVIGYLATGLLLWVVALGDGAGGRSLVVSWRLARGRRWPLAGLALALLVLNVLGLLAFGIGLVVSGAISLAVLAAAYDGLQGAPVPAVTEPVERSTRRSWVAVATDGWLMLLLAYGTTVAVMIAMAAPLVQTVKGGAVTSGGSLLALMLVVPVLVAPVLYWLAARWRGWPGRKLVGGGWGSFGWLGAGVAAWALGLALYLAPVWLGAVRDLAAMPLDPAAGPEAEGPGPAFEGPGPYATGRPTPRPGSPSGR